MFNPRGTLWNPSSFYDQVADKFYKQVIAHEKYNANLNSKLNPSSQSDSETVRKDPLQLTFFDPSDAIGNMLKGKPAYLIFHADTVHQTSLSNVIPITTDPHLRKALPGKIYYERLSPYFAFQPHDVIHHTIWQTTQLAKSTIHYPMRRHLKSWFQMLRHKRLNEVIATDTYFANVKSIEGYHCAQVFFGLTSKMLLFAVKKTESEFADVFLDFIRQYVIPALR